MMKRILVVAFLAIISAQVGAQQVHTVKAGETLSGIAKKYGTSVSNIMKLNDLGSANKILSGSKIKIPSSSSTASAKKNTTVAKKETTTKPLAKKQESKAKASNSVRTHMVKSGETLSGIAKNYGTTVGDIMRLNNMDTDSKLISGKRIKIPERGETVARNRNGASNRAEKKETKSVAPRETKTTKTARKEATSSTPDTKRSRSADNETQTALYDNAISENTDVQDHVADAKTYSENNEGASTIFEPIATSADDAGYFATSFRTVGQETETSGSAKIFKTESGWNDQKYFILMNNIEPGRVVKVRNPKTDKTIYAKVLWNLGSAKENQGLNYRISDAAAKALGADDDRFDLSVAYFK